MLEELIVLDTELFLYLNGRGTQFWDGFWLYITRTLSGITIPIYGLVLFCFYKNFGFKQTCAMLFTAALLFISTEQLSILFKHNIGRLRPCYNDSIQEMIRLVPNYCGGKYSYFSAHAANSSAFASFFIMLLKTKFKPISIVLVIWALLVCYSRIYLGVHFPLDVITGMVFGVFLGWLFSKLVTFIITQIQLAK
jgi:undecaprenyl-diphosphatase